MEKMTRVEKFEILKGVLAGETVDAEMNTVLVEFIDNEIEKISKKRGETKVQKANKEIAIKVAEMIANDEPARVTDILDKYRDELNEIGVASSQKLASILNRDKDNFVKVTEGKNSLFSVVR